VSSQSYRGVLLVRGVLMHGNGTANAWRDARAGVARMLHVSIALILAAIGVAGCDRSKSREPRFAGRRSSSAHGFN